MDTSHQASSLKREKVKSAGEGEEEAVEDILSLGILSWFDIDEVTELF